MLIRKKCLSLADAGRDTTHHHRNSLLSLTEAATGEIPLLQMRVSCANMVYFAFKVFWFFFLLWDIFSIGLVLISDMQVELLLKSGLLHNLV